ncbi:MAG TPA: efflux transporter outer membrane subunit, partial [Methylibium sp.]
MRTANRREEEMSRHKPLVLAVLVLLGGCAVGPDYHRPALPESKAYAPAPLPETSASAPLAGGEAQSFVAGRDIPFEWWKAYGSPALDALVERAFKANASLPAAQAALRQAQELVYAQRGYFSPTVGLGYSFERQQLAGNQGGNSPGIQGNGSTIQTTQNPGGPAPYNGPVIYNFHTAQLTVGYTPDVFGANRRQVESLEAQKDLAYYQLQAAYLTLASNVVAAAIQEASLRAQIAQTESIIAANEKSLQILQRQLATGYAMRLDVMAQETALAQARQTLPPLRKQLEQTRDLIRMLAGQPPDAEVEQRFELADLHLPQELPVSLPSKLVDHRPDVRAAEEQLRSANAQVGAAVAA